MAKRKFKRKNVSFQTQGRLLQELGERLVAKADVALVELIKNAYDADASECEVKSDGKRVEIADDGHGMTEEEFRDKWMHIATPSKQRERLSRHYERTVTGSKGIGRFAVRFLGAHLRVETVAEDPDAEEGRTLLSIAFNWRKIDEAAELHTVKIPYEIGPAPADRDLGTRLIITRLRNPSEIDFNKRMRTELLSIIDPYSGLDAGGFTRSGKAKDDPGFGVKLPTDEGDGESDLTAAILSHAFAKLTIKHENGKVKYRISHRDGRTLLSRTLHRKTTYITSGFCADIRYFPRRAGMFRNTEVDGRSVWPWLKKRGGVGIVDHGFRIRPYGFEDDDWLNLGLDSGHNRRQWRVSFMDKWYPMSPEALSQPKLNPMLYLPNFHQMVGAVFVESSQDFKSDRPTDLTPSMDREGFVDNEAYRELFELVRGGLEMLAYADHEEHLRIEEEEKEAAAKALRADLRQATTYIKKVPGLSARDREAVVARFTTLSKQLDDVEEYYRVSTTKLEMMGLLGVMAGFVTHEMQRVLNGLDRLLARLRQIAKRDKRVRKLVDEVKRTRSEILGQLDYSEAFIDSVHESQVKPEPINARGAVRLVARQFRQFVKDRGIAIDIDIDKGIMSPPLPRALYNGVAMNLFTNALKAAIGGIEADSNPCVVVKAWNEQNRHVLEVADTGVGVPPTLEKRIWDPLFTTTSGQDYNPLGSGMGLGLTLVKRVVTEAKGRISLVKPPPGFKTCFRVEYPRKRGKR